MLREENRRLNIEEFEARRTVLSSSPRFLFVELTRNCNLHCIMCRPEPLRYDSGLDMSFDLFKTIAAQLFARAEVVDLRGWGESTIVRDFLKFIDHAVEYGPQLRLYSNMMKRDDDLWERLAACGCIVGVSFDGGCRETFEAIRRGSKFETVISNIEKLVDANQRHQGHAKNVYLSTVVQRYNLEEIHLIVELAAGLGLGLVKLFPIFCAPNSENNLLHYPREIRRMLVLAEGRARELGVRLELAATLHDSLTVSRKIIPACVHPWMYGHITPDGQLGFCDHLVAFPQYLLGQVRTGEIMETWNNELFQQLRSEHAGLIDRGEEIDARFADCNVCFRGRYVDTEQMVYPPLADQIVSAADLLALS